MPANDRARRNADAKSRTNPRADTQRAIATRRRVGIFRDRSIARLCSVSCAESAALLSAARPRGWAEWRRRAPRSDGQRMLDKVTDNQCKGTGNRSKGADNRKRGAGNHKQGTDSRQKSNDDQD